MIINAQHLNQTYNNNLLEYQLFFP